MMISGILLAGGEATRMGKPKLLLPWRKTTIIGHVVDTYLKSDISELIVVVGANPDKIKRALAKKPVFMVENPHYHEGMGTSIRRGVEAASHKTGGYLIGLGDQPFISADTIDQLITYFVKKRPGIAVCSYKGKSGHPVLFARKFFRDLRSINGDMGGRTIISEHLNEVTYIEVGSKSITLDIDTPEDYQKLTNLLLHNKKS